MSLSAKEKTQLAKLLHRVALYCGDSDDRGYWADKLEKRAFQVTLKNAIKNEHNAGLVKDVTEEAQTIAGEHLRQDLNKVPQECEEAAKLLGSDPQAAEFKEFVMKVALEVSEANWESEKGEIGGTEAIWSFLVLGPLGIMGRVFFTFGFFREGFLDILRNSNGLFRRLNKSVERVSYAEDKAIGTIAAALRADVREQEEIAKISNS